MTNVIDRKDYLLLTHRLKNEFVFWRSRVISQQAHIWSAKRTAKQKGRVGEQKIFDLLKNIKYNSNIEIEKRNGSSK